MATYLHAAPLSFNKYKVFQKFLRMATFTIGWLLFTEFLAYLDFGMCVQNVFRIPGFLRQVTGVVRR